MTPAPGFAVVDLETTGLSFRTDRILQMAIVLVEADGSISGRWSTYVRPERVLSADLGPTHIHGIRRRRLIVAPSESPALRRLASLTADRVVVAHNARFDASFLREAATRHRVGLHWSGLLCTLELSRRLDTERRLLHRLPDVCERYGVRIERAHDALHDALATAKVLPGLLRDNGIDPADEAGGRLLQSLSVS